MRQLPIRYSGGAEINDLLGEFYSITLEARPYAGPRDITFWKRSGLGLRLSTEMFDVAERLELGILTIEPSSERCGIEHKVAFVVESIALLVIEEHDVSAQSGVVMRCVDGREIFVVAGAYPFSLAIDGVAVNLPTQFDPEYPIDRYVRHRVKEKPHLNR